MKRLYRPTDTGVSEYVLEDRKLHGRHHVDHAKANAVLERNKQLRANQGAVKTTSFGKLELDIPLRDMAVIDKFYPGIADPAHPDHRYQLRRFMASPASDPYRLQERKKGVNRGTHIIS